MQDSILESSTRILYSITSLSGKVKLYWSKYLSFSFPGITQAQKRQREILLASKPLLTKEEVEIEFNGLNEHDKIWVLASLQLLSEYAAKIEDWISHREITLLSGTLKGSDRDNSISEKYSKINRNFQDSENRKTFFIDGNISLISLDYFLRWTLLLVCNSLDVDSAITITLNFLAVPFIILMITYWRSRLDRKLNQTLVERTGFPKLFKVRFRYTGLQYSVAGFYLITGLLIAFLLIDNLPGDLATVLAITLYYVFLFNVVPIGRLSEYGLLQQIHSAENKNALDADSNDEAIVSIETQLNSSTGRLEAYVLESALFGALAFSGFLQIISTDLISFPDLEKFASHSFHALQSLINANWVDFEKYAGLLNDKVSLFCLVSIETLVCSAFFLAVIASRLRFSDVADKVRTFLNLAKAYNEKEEQILLTESNEKNLSRLKSINEKIYTYIEGSRLHLKGVGPIVSYMVYFRNAGLFTFLAVLVTSSLFVSSFLGWSFVAIGVMTIVYFNLRSIVSSLSSFGFYFQIFFAKYSKRLLILAALPGLLSFLLSVGLHWGRTDFLITLSYLLVGTYVLIWFALMPHPDDKFGDIENLQDEAWRSSGWRLIKNVYATFILILFVGFSLKTSDLNGANQSLMVGFLGLSLMSYLVGFYLTRPRWLGFFVALTFGTVCLGILFKILHLKGASLMNLTASVLISLFIGLYFIRRKSFHYILFRIAAVFFVMVILFSPLIDKPLWKRIQIMYEHECIGCENIFDLKNRIRQSFVIGEKVDPKMFAESLTAYNKYIDESIRMFGTDVRPTEIFRDANGLYLEMADFIISSSDRDSTALLIAYQAASQVNKVDLFGGYYFWDGVRLQTDALIELGRIEEAKAFLNEVIARAKDEDVRRKANDKLNEVKKIIR